MRKKLIFVCLVLFPKYQSTTRMFIINFHD